MESHQTKNGFSDDDDQAVNETTAQEFLRILQNAELSDTIERNEDKKIQKVFVVLFYSSWIPSKNCNIKDILHLLNDVVTASDDGKKDTISMSVHGIQVDKCDLSQDICCDVLRCSSDLPSISIFFADKHYQVNLASIESLDLIKISSDYGETDGDDLLDNISDEINQVLRTYNEYMKNDQLITLPEGFEMINTEKRNSFIDLLKSNNASDQQKQVVANGKDEEKNDYKTEEPIRIFISGDRSQVGKSSVCLGLLGSLLEAPFHYLPEEIAYIKPATQCEKTQLVAKFCASKKIESIPIGPIVYYKGYTRSFLNGETEFTVDELLDKVGEVVDNLSINKKVVIIDGVGYPAVGSICGSCNATVAKASGYKKKKNSQSRIPVPVLLVGKSGVGDAIDSYNINASYFFYNGVQVLGGIFNRFATEGFYSLDNCKVAILSYFEQYKNKGESAYGFLPELKKKEDETATPNEDEELKYANDFIRIFSHHVDVESIIKDAAQYLRKEREKEDTRFGTTSATPTPSFVREKKKKKKALSRQEIEKLAMNAGAKGG